MAASAVHYYDILIAGAGAVGASLACGLANTGYRIGLIEALPLDADSTSTHDGRGLALSLGTQQQLARLGVWPQLAEHANPIEHIHVSHRGHFGVVHLDAERLDLSALGYVVPALRLGRALLAQLQAADNIDFICPATLRELVQTPTEVRVTLDMQGAEQTLAAPLLVGADGSESRVRRLCDIGTTSKDYGQTAIVSTVRPRQPHRNTAYERFTADGPFALLPLRDGRCVSVCCLATDAIEALMAQSDRDYGVTLAARFGGRLGGFSDIGERRSYPLRLVQSEQQQAGRVLLLGNSVHTLHPNAAQGFNLGLHDATALAERLRRHAGDPGDPGLLAAYLRQRGPVQRRVVRFTDSLAWLFYEPHTFIGPLRTLGMLGLELLPPLQRLLVQRAAGLKA